MKPAPLPLPRDVPLRVVLDTNAVLSLWHYRHPRLVGLLGWLEDRRAALLTRATTLDELARVLRLPDLAIDPDRQADLLADYRARTVPFAEPDAASPDASLPRCRDRDDQKFLALAWEAGAHLLLTRDKRVLAMATRPPWRDRTLIVTPERLLRHVDAE
jgi:putative PIN family toxin of toxin-antitoxin system